MKGETRKNWQLREKRKKRWGIEGKRKQVGKNGKHVIYTNTNTVHVYWEWE